MMGSLVGESEANLRQAIKVIEGLGACVAWLDEIEKAVAGSGTDTSGVTTRMVGSLLTWMTEKTSPVYIVATANDVSALPPELLRKGRFDEIWVVDLPHPGEREAILRVHLAKRKRDANKLDIALLAAKAEHFSGAELEQAVKDALHIAFSDGKREVTTDDVYQAISSTTPLATTFAERIMGLRAWARGRARMASRAPEAVKDEAATARKLDLDEGVN
jgi:SpoVK/Ycf46/Vps4 family AAA+-type ATPase